MIGNGKQNETDSVGTTTSIGVASNGTTNWSGVPDGYSAWYNGRFPQSAYAPSPAPTVANGTMVFSGGTVSTLAGPICVTEATAEVLELWKGSACLEDFRVKVDSVVGGLGLGDFIAIVEYSLKECLDVKVFERTGSLSESIFDIVRDTDLFDEHVSSPDAYAHFYTDMMRVQPKDSRLIERFIETCLEKKSKLRVAL